MPTAVDPLVAEVARAIEADLPALTEELTTWFTEVIPEFQHDETVRGLMVASTSSNLVAIVDLLKHSIPVEQISVPTAAAEYARRFAQHSLSLEALLRAYRLGENRFTKWGITALDRIDGVPTGLALAAVAELSLRTHRYLDQVIEGLIEIYETERRLWNSRIGAARAAQIRLVLDSESLSEAEVHHLLGIPMTCWHTAAVAWLPAEGPSPAGTLDAAARLMQEVSGTGTPLTLLNDERTMWIWTQHPAPAASTSTRCVNAWAASVPECGSRSAARHLASTGFAARSVRPCAPRQLPRRDRTILSGSSPSTTSRSPRCSRRSQRTSSAGSPGCLAHS
ncbi:hypothetical protein [Streptomyces sp. BK022]|uniref:hypothetical protein n=1 Tax=Streptomyces sp. BK022 TaxID=2512123 RepID=UPI001F5FE097|nr:hypothetical protein [Streptomyces sp. BK022]